MTAKPGNHRLVFDLKDFTKLPFLKGGQELTVLVEHQCDIDRPRPLKVRLRREGNKVAMFDPEDRG